MCLKCVWLSFSSDIFGKTYVGATGFEPVTSSL